MGNGIEKVHLIIWACRYDILALYMNFATRRVAALEVSLWIQGSTRICEYQEAH